MASDLLFALKSFVNPRKLGRAHMEMVFDFRKQIGRKRRLDVSFVSFERWAADRPLPDEADWEVVPDLAVEGVSSSNSFEEQIEKKNEYLQLGVQEVWIV